VLLIDVIFWVTETAQVASTILTGWHAWKQHSKKKLLHSYTCFHWLPTHRFFSGVFIDSFSYISHHTYPAFECIRSAAPIDQHYHLAKGDTTTILTHLHYYVDSWVEIYNWSYFPYHTTHYVDSWVEIYNWSYFPYHTTQPHINHNMPLHVAITWFYHTIHLYQVC
jgi:hypothetical protein